MNINNSKQHYRLTLDEAISHYRKGWITATALLYYYLRIRLAPGWKCTLHHREITKKLGIPKTSFYRAIENLSQEGLINWEAPNGLVVSLMEQQSHEWNSNPTDETESPTNGTESPTNGTKTQSKIFKSKADSDPSNSYQLFFKSLSDSAREKFLAFVREKIENFPKLINDVEGWLAGKNQAGQYRWQVYYEIFQSEFKGAVASNQDFSNHPKRDEWIEQIRLGKPRFVAMYGSPSEQPIRKAFADWAIANNLVWGDKS